ncbi:hypothetical protein P8452_26021 [Trifolium repens]|nr:hypothetical protein P8452_26021 [Trifolium repens]
MSNYIIGAKAMVVGHTHQVSAMPILFEFQQKWKDLCWNLECLVESLIQDQRGYENVFRVEHTQETCQIWWNMKADKMVVVEVYAGGSKISPQTEKVGMNG